MLAVLASIVLAGCGPAKHNKPVDVSSLPVADTPTFPSATATVTLSAPPPATASSGHGTGTASGAVTVHPAPAAPLRTASVSAGSRHYVLSIWAERHDTDCAAHAYGQVQLYLQLTPCSGMTRRLATTTVAGRPVGFAVTSILIPGPAAQPYRNAAAFRQLVEKDGTGSVYDLMREGWRLPSGPTSVPAPDAFRALSQDTGVDVYDLWYLDGPTPDNDPALLQLAQDVYLQY